MANGSTTTPSEPAKPDFAEVEKVVLDTVSGYLAHPKAGLKTTELWVTVLGLADSLALAKWHTDLHLSGWATAVAAGANAVISVGYAAARSWLKAKHIQVIPPKP